MFPSPCGDELFLNDALEEFKKVEVSVPLRG